MVYNANGLYPHKAQISNEFNSSAVSNKGILACHGYSFEENPDAFDMYPFTDRANSLGTGITFSLYGRLAIDLFTCEKLLLPNTKVRIKLIRARPNFYMLSDNPNVSLKIVDCSLFTRRILVAEPNHQYLQWNLEREPAQYNYMETIARTFIIPSRQNQFIQENIFNNAPIRRVAVAMNTNSAVAGSFYENRFNYQQFHLRELRIIRGGRAIISLDTTSPCRPYVTTMKAMQFNKDFPALPMEDFQNHYILVFDLTSLQVAAEQLHNPELSGESLRLEMFFQFPLEQVTEVTFFPWEKDYRMFKLTNSEHSLKMFSFFEFSGSYKNIVAFLRLFIVIVSVLYILFFFRPKSPEKAANECCLIENPRHFFNLDCKSVFNKFCPVHKFCV